MVTWIDTRDLVNGSLISQNFNRQPSSRYPQEVSHVSREPFLLI